MRSSATADGAFLGLDVGTSAVKAGVYTADGVRLGGARAAVTVRSPRPGWRELNPEEVWRAVVQGARGAVEQAGHPRVRAVATSAASPTPMLAVGGRPVTGICTFSDARAAQDLEELRRRIDDGAFRQLTGNRLGLPTCSALTALRLRADLGAAAERSRFGHLSTLIVSRLTGRWVMDPTNASYTGAFSLLDPARWSSDAAAAVDMPPDMLPELLASAEPAGVLTAEAAQALGLDRGTVVATGAADTAAAALAVGCVEDGDAFESLGTSGVLTVCQQEPAAVAHTMNRAHVVPGRWLTHAAMSSSGAAAAWLRERALAGAVGQDLDALGALAAAAPPGAGGLLFLPYLAGERSPVWDPAARGAWVGMTLDTTTAHLARSVFEAAGYGLRQLLDLERSVSGRGLAELLSVGGGASSLVWSSIRADITGRTFHRAVDGDAAARGAALLAATAAGIHSGALDAARASRPVATDPVVPTADPATRAVYDRMYALYLDLYPALESFFAPLQSVASVPGVREPAAAPSRPLERRAHVPVT